MPNPMPPADRKHGSGARNDPDVARQDQRVHEHRDAEEAKDAREAGREAKRREGVEHP